MIKSFLGQVRSLSKSLENLILSEDERFEQTYTRKIREALLALQLTRKYSKDEILALYLNQMYYGGMSYGVEAASQTYFGKTRKRVGFWQNVLY